MEEDYWNPEYTIRMIPRLFDDQFDEVAQRKYLTEAESVRRRKLIWYVGKIENALVNEREKGTASVIIKPTDHDLEEELKEHFVKRGNDTGYSITVNRLNDTISFTAAW